MSIDASSTFAAILALNPVSYNWKTEATSTPAHIGFIAQAVQSIFPDLVSQGPDGFYTLNYAGFAPYIVKAIQSLAAEVTNLQQTVAGFADNFVSAHITVTTLDVGTVTVSNGLCAKKNDGTSVCVTNDQLAALLEGSGSGADQSPAVGQVGPASSSTAPVIQINGESPAIIHIGDTYADLGATITRPTADINLGIKTFLNGALVSNIVLGTTAVATDTIDYVATDVSGLTSTSTRTVVIEAAPSAPTSIATSTLSSSPSEASTTEASSTAQ